jgi:hypothetical protein
VSLISYSHTDPCPLSYHVPDAGTCQCHVAPGRIVRTAVATTASTRARPSSLALVLKNFQAGPSNRESPLASLDARMLVHAPMQIKRVGAPARERETASLQVEPAPPCQTANPTRGEDGRDEVAQAPEAPRAHRLPPRSARAHTPTAALVARPRAPFDSRRNANATKLDFSAPAGARPACMLRESET